MLTQERLEAIRQRAKLVSEDWWSTIIDDLVTEDIPDLLAEVERLRNEINFIANVDMSRAYDAEHVAVSVKSWALNVLEGVDIDD